MDTLIYFFAVAVLLVCTLAAIGIWSPRRLWVKATAVAVTTLFAVVAYAGMTDLLSKPKPVSLEWAQRNAPGANVLAASMRENEAIFLWLEFEGAASPRAYVLPWSRAAAEQLQAAMREAEANGTGVQMEAPFETDRQTTDQMFYAAPQPAMPTKRTAAAGGPLVYEPSLAQP